MATLEAMSGKAVDPNPPAPAHDDDDEEDAPLEELEQYLSDHDATELSLTYCGRSWLQLIPEAAAETRAYLKAVSGSSPTSPTTPTIPENGDDAPFLLPTRFWRCPDVFDVSGAKMEEDHAMEFAASVVPLLRRTTVLDLSDNRIGTVGWAAVAEALAKHCQHLEHLSLTENLIRDAGARMTAVLLSKLPKLIALSMGTCMLTPKAGPVLFAGIRNAQSLVSLSLEYNGLGDEGVAEVARALPLAPKLAFLNLSDNAIGDKGAVALAEALMTAHVTKLNLAVNAIELQGAQAIASVLQLPTRLRNLDIACNKFGPAGVKAFAGAVAVAPVIEVLDLTTSYFDPESGAAMADALERNKAVKLVWFNNPDVGAAAGDRLVDLMEARDPASRPKPAKFMDETVAAAERDAKATVRTAGLSAAALLSGMAMVGLVVVAGAVLLRRRRN